MVAAGELTEARRNQVMIIAQLIPSVRFGVNTKLGTVSDTKAATAADTLSSSACMAWTRSLSPLPLEPEPSWRCSPGQVTAFARTG